MTSSQSALSRSTTPLLFNGPVHEAGVGMIEVLVAIVVVALGVIGIINMQINMIKANQSALMRSEAVLLAADMTDRMRVDRQAALGNAYDRAFDDAVPGTGTLPGAEIADWLARIGDALPDGAGAIAVNGARVTVSIRWDDSRGEQAAEIFEVVSEL